MSTPMYDLPEHFAIPVDKNGNGPAEGYAIHRIACTCGDDTCKKGRKFVLTSLLEEWEWWVDLNRRNG